MCGIAGVFGTPTGPDRLEKTGKMLAHGLRHRGPDSQTWIKGEDWVLAHARLAVIDPEGGRQPFPSADQQQFLVGNHEIYNYRELRKELEVLGHCFTTESDTEVLLAGWRQWGKDVFPRLNGMFAVAIIDQTQGVCVLARDPMGIKPLHWVRAGRGYAFSSEISPLLESGFARREMNADSAHLFMNLRYLPGEKTLFEGVERLRPGTCAILSRDRDIEFHRFFSWDDIGAGRLNDYGQALGELEEVLPSAVERHLVSDVEVGAYLSGGLDSSLITCLATRKLNGMRSYCLAFGEASDENSDAERVAALCRTRHSNVHVGEAPLSRLAEVIRHVEEPKVNLLQGYVLAEKVRKDIKVVLSGLGGDELFAGYTNNDILFPMAMISRLHRTKTSSRNLAWLQSVASAVPGSLATDHFFRAAELGMTLDDPLRFYCILRNAFDHNPYLMRSIYASPEPQWHDMTASALRPYFNIENPDILNETLKLEARTKLANDFLLTEDRVSMAHGLEVRVPFLDRELVETAFAMPSRFKYLPGQKKRILRQVARNWLPSDVLAKKKWGFSFDPVHLFEHGLKDTARGILTRQRVSEMGLFSWKWIEQVLEASPSRWMRWHYFNLWAMVGFTIWHEMFIQGKAFESTSRTRT